MALDFTVLLMLSVSVKEWHYFGTQELRSEERHVLVQQIIAASVCVRVFSYLY